MQLNRFIKNKTQQLNLFNNVFDVPTSKKNQKQQMSQHKTTVIMSSATEKMKILLLQHLNIWVFSSGFNSLEDKDYFK